MVLPRSLRHWNGFEGSLALDDLPNLDYFHSIGLGVRGPAKTPVGLYIQYFQAEQENATSTCEKLYHSLAEAETDQNDQSRAVLKIIEGRRLLQVSNPSTKLIEKWLEPCALILPARLLPYAHFLAGTAYSHTSDQERADHYLNLSSMGFFARGLFDRELLSLIQRPTLSVENLLYLRVYAREIRDLKAVHCTNLSLARAYHKGGELDLARRSCLEAIQGFRSEFLDPRRQRIAQALLDRLSHFTAKESQLLELLDKRPQTKEHLMEFIYGKNYYDMASIDSRFRTLLSRLNRKLGQKIKKTGDLYVLCHKM